MRRLRERRRFIQVLAGPRQVGKTTLARQVLSAAGIPQHMATADEPTLRRGGWLEAQWEIGRVRARQNKGRAVLVLDEVQKIPAWSETVKRLWDEDSAEGSKLHVLLLGSSPLLMLSGLTESLAGRFEVIRLPHWSYSEMRAAFGWDLTRFLYFGGYPGSADLVRDRNRWARYITDSLIETTISRDVLLQSRIDKPALLRQLFQLTCDYSGQVLSYTKMLGQLQDAGNATTLMHYLKLLHGAGLVAGLQKFSGSRARQRGSIPKLVALNTALVTAHWDLSPAEARRDLQRWGFLVETAAGAHLLNATAGTDLEIFYWRERNQEVDYVLRRGKSVVGLEITSGGSGHARSGLDAFRAQFPGARGLLIGGDGIPLEEFFSKSPDIWLDGSRLGRAPGATVASGNTM